MKLKLCDELTLPLDIVTARIATYGTSGSGKTAFGRLLAESVHAAGHRFCAIDLKNDWWGLKSSADGKSAGIPVVIFGGPKRDVQIFDDGGAAVADTVAAIRQSVVIDLDEFSKEKQLRFLTHFLERLYDVNREPLLLIADEADRYAPQKAMSVDANVSLGAAEDICRRGRKRGIGSMWLTQRTAVLNKNVSDICDLTVVFRTPGSRDLDELQDRVGRVAAKDQVAEVMRQAPRLADGQAIFLSSHPKLRECLPANAAPIQLPLPQTFDSSATPGVGKRRAEPKVLAKSDLAEIEARMASQVERAKAEDPAALRREVSRLNQELDKARKIVAEPAAVLAPDEMKLLKSAHGLLETGFPLRLDGLAKRLETSISAAVDVCRKLAPLVNANWQKNLHLPNEAATRVPIAQRTDSVVHDAGEVRLNAAQKRILDALAWFGSIGNEAPTNLQVGAIALMDATGGHFSNVVGPLSTNGLVARAAGRMSLTHEGRKHAQVPRQIATLADYHNVLRQRIRRARSASGKTVDILDAVIRRRGQEVSSEEIGREVGIDHTGGHFSNTIGPLSTLGLITRSQGIVRPTEMVFPRGLS